MPAGGVGCSSLPCLRRLCTHDDDDSGGGDGVMMTMVMMDGPHCPWVIYNNDDAVQCYSSSWSWSWLCTVSQTSSRNNQPLVHDVQAARVTECGAQVEGPVVPCAFPGEVVLEAPSCSALKKELAD